MSTKRSILRTTVLNWRWWLMLPVALAGFGLVLFLSTLNLIGEGLVWGVERASDTIKPFSSWMVKWVHSENTSRIRELKMLEDSASRNAQLAALRHGNAKYKNIMNHRVDVVLFNKKKFPWMEALEFEV